jgi:hypothetical protein
MDNFTKIKPKLENVTKEQFEEFLKNYPRPLLYDYYGVCMPPLITYNDRKIADKFPNSIVALTYAYEDESKHYFYCPPEERIYQIATNLQEILTNI